MGKALNISQGGIFIETPQMIFSEFISLMSVDDNNNLVEIMGEVIYSTVYRTGTFGSGIRFSEMFI
jgi:Tfp pilus assembly protein PilZ